MLPDKIELNATIRMVIADYRDLHDITAEELAGKCGRNRYWLTNIETARTKRVQKADLIKLFTIILDSNEAEAEETIEGYLNANELQNSEILDEYEDNQTKKELKRKITETKKKIDDLYNHIDFSDADSVYKYGRYLLTLSELVITENGNKCFEQLFKYPLQRLESGTRSEIERILCDKNKLQDSYEPYIDGDGNHALKIDDGSEHIFD